MSGHHGHDHSHAVVTEGNARKLTIALILTSTFLVIEVIAGLITQSLALLSDAAHMFTDAAALAIALAAIQIAKRPADNKRTFGYQRFEILAALFNASMLFFVAMYILYEAYQRFSQPPEIQSLGMLIVASIGLVINLISMKILMSSAADSLNVKGAYLEVLSDALGSVGVIIGAVIIYFTNWYWVDTIIAVAIGFWVLPRTWILLKQSINILLEGVPEEVDIEKLRNDLLALDGVESIHQLKVWAITSKNIHLTVHLFAPNADRNQLHHAAAEMLSHEHGIAEVTLQIEDDAEMNCQHTHQHDEDEEHGHSHQH
ncbi:MULTISPECIES: cation diffusion facilitator family transporter [unclassified Acinetobacter]|uniref:cation diffusion facilitator family transporter n=1 Tax=unclassified Acinetobacter TaxID=196816 RepID=UPI00244C414D|nr:MULTISPECIES: cation diffusion facilitator family transporter [unclassified Acinetobacter]MDH0029877.1 cation diffusion facilitator family transporter [Acinetobacter sp. GD04021]MDH0885359.1 cation diffusion facilitator family transporter [Acinetobacter sp. GD03873]MDH1081477.1 cation diffusion facilitator family transporter [Acinetobacter sp. GD03983]MDH2188742.1 cation diffusion facilitator family transporter [Acinetobacter sp. GD03645]MDH2203465.1 cation diffusion facilitator family tran